MNRETFLQGVHSLVEIQHDLLHCLCQEDNGNIWSIESINLQEIDEHQDEAFLRMKLSASIPREVEVDVEEEDEQYLALPQTLLQHSPDGMEAFDAVLDVVFSDVYQTAAPFLKVWRRSTGEAVSLTRLQTWIDQWRNANENMMDQGMDHRVYHLGSLVQEYHPVIFREQFNTLHLCEVVNHLQLIAEDVGQSAFANSCILLCLSLLGPYLGLRFTPAQHKLLVQKCTNREECLAEVYTL